MYVSTVDKACLTLRKDTSQICLYRWKLLNHLMMVRVLLMSTWKGTINPTSIVRRDYVESLHSTHGTCRLSRSIFRNCQPIFCLYINLWDALAIFLNIADCIQRVKRWGAYFVLTLTKYKLSRNIFTKRRRHPLILTTMPLSANSHEI